MVFYVNNQRWDVVYCNSLSDNLRRSDGSLTLGVTDNSTKCVYMNNKLKGLKHEHVLCHELCHVVCFEYNVKISIDLEERLCNFMADHAREIVEILDDILYALKYNIS